MRPQNRTIIGNRGSGKSVSLENMIVESAPSASMVVIDWPGTLADRHAARLTEMGLESRLVADKALWTDKLPQWPFLPESTSTDPLRREIDEDITRQNAMAGFFGRRGVKDGSLKPATFRSANAALAVYQGVTVKPPLHWILKLFRRGDNDARWMLEQTRNQWASDVFRDADRGNPQNREFLLGAGQRLLEILQSPVLWGRNGDSLDWKQFIRTKGHYSLDMSGIPQPLAKALGVFVYNSAINANIELFNETHQAHPLIIVLEEAGALDLVTPIIVGAMQAWRKAGISVWIVSQTTNDFEDQDAFEQILSMSEHYWHQMASGVERAARDCAAPTFDANKVIHTEERSVIKDYSPQASKTVTTDDKGHTRSVSESVNYRPVLGVQVQKTYDNPQNHEAEFRRELSTLGVGVRFSRSAEGIVRRESVQMMEEPWGIHSTEVITYRGVTQSMYRHRLYGEVYPRVRSRPTYAPPPIQWQPPTPPAARGMH